MQTDGYVEALSAGELVLDQKKIVLFQNPDLFKNKVAWVRMNSQ